MSTLGIWRSEMSKSVLFSDITIVSPMILRCICSRTWVLFAVLIRRLLYAGSSEEDAVSTLKNLKVMITLPMTGKNKILCPAFANAHAHTPMSIFRNIADDRALQDWLFGQIIPREDKMIPDDFYYGNLLTIAEMVESGTACAANMYDGALLIAKGAVESGFRVQQTSMGKKCIDGKWSIDKDSVEELNDFIRKEGNGLISHSLLVRSRSIFIRNTSISLFPILRRNMKSL